MVPQKDDAKLAFQSSCAAFRDSTLNISPLFSQRNFSFALSQNRCTKYTLSKNSIYVEMLDRKRKHTLRSRGLKRSFYLCCLLFGIWHFDCRNVNFYLHLYACTTLRAQPNLVARRRRIFALQRLDLNDASSLPRCHKKRCGEILNAHKLREAQDHIHGH